MLLGLKLTLSLLTFLSSMLFSQLCQGWQLLVVAPSMPKIPVWSSAASARKVVVIPVALAANLWIVVVPVWRLMAEASALSLVPRRVATAIWVSTGSEVFGFNITSNDIVSKFCTTCCKILFDLRTRNSGGRAKRKKCGQEECRLEKHYGQMAMI